jgi:ABC-2 type transport system permease protein
MRNILLVMLNTLKVTLRKKSNIIVYLILPVIIAVASIAIFGKNSSSPARIGVSNYDNGILSENMVEDLKKIEKFKITEVKAEDIKTMVSEGKVDCVLKIPSDFSESLYKVQKKNMELITVKGEDATAWIESYVNIYTGNLLNIAKASEGKREVFNSIYENFRKGEAKITIEKVADVANSKVVTGSGLGFLIMFMMLGTSTVASLILKEKKSRTYFRILSSPVSSRDYVVGNVLANFTIVFIQSILVIIGITKVMRINTFIADWQLLIILLCFGLAAIGIGLIIVAFSTTSNQAGYLSTFIVTPTCMLGGCFWPVDFMPESLKRISEFMPQRWTLEAVTKIQNGGNINSILINLGLLLSFAAALFLIAAYRMKTTNSVKSFV